MTTPPPPPLISQHHRPALTLPLAFTLTLTLTLQNKTNQAMKDPGFEPPPSPKVVDPADSLTCGLDRLMQNIDGKPTTNGVFNNSGIKTNHIASAASRTESAATAAKFAETFPSQSGPAPTKIHSAPTSVGSQSRPAENASTPAPVEIKPYERQSRGHLVVSPLPAPAVGESLSSPVSSPPMPTVTLSSKSPPQAKIRKGGARKLGARKLGAMKLGSGSGAVKLSGFKEIESTPAPAHATAAVGGGDADLLLARKLQEEEDAAATSVVAPSSRIAAVATAALSTNSSFTKNQKNNAAGGGSLYRSSNDSSQYGGGSATNGYRNGGSSTSSSGYRSSSASGSTRYDGGMSGPKSGGGGYGGSGGGAGGESFDKDKYKDVKGIGSDMLFGVKEDDWEEQARRKIKNQEYSQSAAISSDMYFDREMEGDYYNASGGGGGLGSVAEKIAVSAVVEIQGATEAANKLKVRFCFHECVKMCVCFFFLLVFVFLCFCGKAEPVSAYCFSE